jgi:molybdenum cofactor guanylyltransferase
MTDVSSFITAGGRSSRMGTDKAWLELDGRPMIEHVIAAVAPLTKSVGIIANLPEYERLGYPVFGDTHVGIGPLEAIRTALSNSSTSHVILVACDLPFVTTELFSFLLKNTEEHYVTVPIGPDGNLEPLCAVYHREALAAVNDLIEEGQRKVRLLFDRVPTRVIAFEEMAHLSESSRFFENINTPEDYSKVRISKPNKPNSRQ